MNIRMIRETISRARWMLSLGLTGVVLATSGHTVHAVEVDLNAVGALHTPLAEHVEQLTFTNLVISGRAGQAYEELFELGDELFATPFNALDGGGAEATEPNSRDNPTRSRLLQRRR